MGNDFDEAASSCEGDSGSPVIRRVSETSRGKPYYQQEYVVSTGLDCNLKATIYARVSSREILTWIQQTTDTNPLVVVIGGYTLQKLKGKKLITKTEPGPESNIEIISEDRKCRKGMRAAEFKEKKFCDAACQKRDPNDPNVVGFIFSDADAIGATAQYTKDAPIYCGGKSWLDNLNICWEYDYRLNR